MKSKQDQVIIDPTPERKYLRAKASRLNIKIIENKSDVVLNNDANWKRVFSHDMGWTKLLENLPAISN